MRRLIARGLFIACLGAALPAGAGSVYVPYTADVTVNGVQYRTQIWASNRGSEARRFQTFFIAAGADGTSRPNVQYTTVGVPATSTVLLGGLTAADTVGMLEVDGAPQVVISARLNPVGDASGKLGANLPVISSETQLTAGTTAHLQGLSSSAEQATDLVIVNLAKQQATCSASTFAANGSSLGNSAELTVAPLSLVRAADFLASFNNGATTGARVSVSCNRNFYAHAVTFDSVNSGVTVINPSELLTSALARPGSDNNNGVCPQGAICFSKAGTFFAQVPPAIFHIEQFDVPPGVYKKVRFRVEVFHGGWGVLSNSGGLHSLFWLVRDRNFDLLGFSVFRKPNDNDVMFRHGIGIEATQKPKIFFPVEGIPGHTYLVDYTYDLGNRRLNYKLIDQTTGQTVIDYVDRPNVNELTMNPGQRLRADFGFNEGRNENEDPGYNWKYSNLFLEVYPQ